MGYCIGSVLLRVLLPYPEKRGNNVVQKITRHIYISYALSLKSLWLTRTEYMHGVIGSSG